MACPGSPHVSGQPCLKHRPSVVRTSSWEFSQPHPDNIQFWTAFLRDTKILRTTIAQSFRELLHTLLDVIYSKQALKELNILKKKWQRRVWWESILATFSLAGALEDYQELPLPQDGRKASRMRLDEGTTEEQVERTTQLSGTTTGTHKYSCPYSRQIRRI
jgi:hypothetical protein